MRAIMVSVDYADLLSVTLPHNRRHFQEVMVVTSPTDQATEVVALENRCTILKTDLFYQDGAAFNKWRALEHALDIFGRRDWLCVMDADVLWPRDICFREEHDKITWWMPNAASQGGTICQTKGILAGPLRHMCPWPITPIPDERTWGGFPIHRNVNEWAGYSQIFHANDPVLGEPPWHETDWESAGAADSFFQQKWVRERKIRLPFNVLHLGEAGQNWYGRATRYADGKLPKGSAEKIAKCTEIWRVRNERRRAGLDPFAGERIKG